MINNRQTLALTTTSTTLNLDAIQFNQVPEELNQYNFYVPELGTGYFSCLPNSINQDSVECVPLQSLVWNDQEIDLVEFLERSVCFDQGELMGLNLCGEGWAIIFNLGIKINGRKTSEEVAYQPIVPLANSNLFLLNSF
ncbi:MAG TPA: hypothetical protein DCY91_29225 [Cyanobacteria bacterium UBA11370]|nr:hypothetical protein [Cyanobacteria bacterium UBA11370]HBY80278.1 hypothetical protein [Cyanobacteria bacterium UBA11148]